MTKSFKRVLLAAAVAVNTLMAAGAVWANEIAVEQPAGGSRDWDIAYTGDGKPIAVCVNCWFYSCDC